MRLAYSSNAYTRSDLLNALHSIAKLGYEGAEILCDRPHWFPGEVSREDIDKVLETITRLGLQVSNLNANTAIGYYQPLPPENVFEPSLSNPDPAIREWRIKYSIEAIKLAHSIGASCISLTSGRPMPGYSPESLTSHFIDSMKAICELAEHYNIKVGIEYEPGLLLERATEVKQVIDQTGSPMLGVNLDIGHSYLNHEDPQSTINLLSGRIWNVHVEDIKDNKHFHLVPGDGDLPFSKYFDALKNCNYDGFLTVELYSFPEKPDEAGQRSLDYLRNMKGL